MSEPGPDSDVEQRASPNHDMSLELKIHHASINHPRSPCADAIGVSMMRDMAMQMRCDPAERSFVPWISWKLRSFPTFMSR